MRWAALLLVPLVALADPVVVRWTPATAYEPLTIEGGGSETPQGAPLPLESAWTFVTQYLGTCPTDPAEVITTMPLAGVGKWNGSSPIAVFEQAVGSCRCYEARTIVWRDAPENRVSRPARAEKCIDLSCHPQQ